MNLVHKKVEGDPWWEPVFVSRFPFRFFRRPDLFGSSSILFFSFVHATGRMGDRSRDPVAGRARFRSPPGCRAAIEGIIICKLHRKAACRREMQGWLPSPRGFTCAGLRAEQAGIES